MAGSRIGSRGPIGDGGACGSGNTTCSPAHSDSKPAAPAPRARRAAVCGSIAAYALIENSPNCSAIPSSRGTIRPGMSSSSVLLSDEPLPGVRRFTLNRPQKRNALNNELRGAILAGLQAADADPAVRVSILRGAGPAFSSGYDLSADNSKDQPYYSPGGPGQWARHVVDGWFTIWDLAKPVIAQVHGYCLAGGSDLAACCDLVYVAEDARIGYPPTRLMSPPDNQFHPWLMGMRTAMEMFLTGDAITGAEAAAKGFANRAFPAAELDEAV